MERDPRNINPYDLGAVGREQRREREAKVAAAHAEFERRIKRLESFGETINPYDLGQMAHILEPLNVLDCHHF